KFCEQTWKSGIVNFATLILQILKSIVAGILETNTIEVPQPFLDLVLLTWFKILIRDQHWQRTMTQGGQLWVKLILQHNSVLPDTHQITNCEETATAARKNK
ncbi:hypothetical protein CEXT_570191, partial [Caerostris extrusa]